MKTAKTLFLAAVLGAAAASAQAQERSALVVDQTEAIVTVTDVDRNARVVTFRGPEGRVGKLAVPPEAQNLDQVSPGARFKLRYLQSVAIALSTEGTAAAEAGETVRLAPKGGNPGGMIARTAQVTGVIEEVDLAGRRVTLRGPAGDAIAFNVAQGVSGLERMRVGYVVSVSITEALALDMIPAAQP